MRKLLFPFFLLLSFIGHTQPYTDFLNQIKGTGFTGYSLPIFSGTQTDTIKPAAVGYYLRSIAGAPGFEFQPVAAGGGDLATTLGLGDITGGNDIKISNGDFITTPGGNIQFDFGSDAYFALTTDGGGYSSPYITMSATNLDLAWANGGLTGVAASLFIQHATQIQLSTALLNIGYLGGSGTRYLQTNNAGDISTVAIPTPYTDESAQDAVGNNLGAGLSYDDATPQFAVNFAYTSQTVDFTISLTDVYKHIDVNSAATWVTVTIPTNATVAFPIGTYIWLTQTGTAQVNVEAAVGVTLQSPASYTATRLRYSTIRLQKTATNTWQLAEDLGAFAGYDADATLYFNAVGTFTNAEKTAINSWFVSAKANGYYTKYKAVYLFAGSSLTAFKWNAVNPVDADANFRMLFYNTPTAGSNRITFNGTTQYATTKLTPSVTLTQDSKHISYYLMTAGVGADFGVVNTATGYNGEQLMSNYGGTLYHGISRGASTLAPPATRTGIWQLNRSSSTNMTLRHVNTNLATIATASDNNVAYEILLGARGNNASAVVHNASTVGFFAIGTSFTLAEEALEYTDLQTLNTALGR